MWENISTFIRTHNRFVVTTHIQPEGDAIGSEVALAAFLEDLGKEVAIVNSSPTPDNCRFLALADTIKVYPEEFTRGVVERADAIMIVDVNNWDHVGPFGDVLRKATKPRACIDHHQGAGPAFADVSAIDTRAAAAGLMIYDLINYMGGTFTPRIADAIYTAILTDTGSFRFSNTDARAFRAAADLCAKGVEPFDIYRKVYSKRWGAARLTGPALSTLNRTPDGKIAWIRVTRSMFADAGAEYEDSDRLLELVRPIEGIELCLSFKEMADGKVKVSLRSNGAVDAFAIATKHGGGGHRMAAGMTVDGPIDRAVEAVIADCVKNHVGA